MTAAYVPNHLFRTQSAYARNLPTMEPKMSLNPEDLNVDSFEITTQDQAQQESRVILTVWIYIETQQYVSCGGTCGSCPCYA